MHNTFCVILESFACIVLSHTALVFLLITRSKNSMIADRPSQLFIFTIQPVCISFEEKYLYINIYISV